MPRVDVSLLVLGIVGNVRWNDEWDVWQELPKVVSLALAVHAAEHDRKTILEVRRIILEPKKICIRRMLFINNCAQR